MYENYGGKRPEIPDRWEEVGYRLPKGCETFISPTTGYIIAYGPGDFRSERVIVRRKPVIDPALVAPQGYQFRLDEYGRPVCRAPKAGERFINASGKADQVNESDFIWCNTFYILDPIPSPPKMTIVEAAKAAGPGRRIRRREWPFNLWYSLEPNNHGMQSDTYPHQGVLKYCDISADDWEVVP